MKIRLSLIVFFVSLFQISVFSQVFSGTIDGFTGKVFLQKVNGEKYKTIDSITCSGSSFSYEYSPKVSEPGVFRLYIDRNKYADFVLDNENVSFKTSLNSPFDSMNIIDSDNNKLYYQFLKINKLYKTKSELLWLILTRYPKEDDYFKTTKETLNQLQTDYITFVNRTSQQNPKSFIARYIRSGQLPVIDSELPYKDHLDFLKSHALDLVNFNDFSLINSNVFSNKSIEYLTYFRNPQLPIELLEKEFRGAIDSILNKAKINSVVYKHVAEYLIDGFKQFGFHNVVDYILNNYVIKDDICLDAQLENSIQKRIDQAKQLQINFPAPNVILPDNKGKVVDISKINKMKLLIFYSTECPHCGEMLPQIYNLYKNSKNSNIEVIAVSLDTNKDEWTKFIKDKGLNWINLSDLKGWNSKSASDYFIYATPTMFLLDSNLKIVAKPMEISEVSKYFN